MPTKINGYSPSEETALSSLIINEVDSNETFEKMKEKNLLQDNQLYLVTDEQGGGTYYTAGEVDALLQNKANTSSVYTKTEADALLQKKVNPNLLDNWYFLNPVNQRGVTSGTAGWNEYFLDRWQGHCIYDATKGYLEVGSDSYIVQRIENGGLIPYPVTFSILFQDGTFGYQTVSADGGFILIGENVKGYADSQIHKENSYISYINNSGSTVGITAVKLELGDTQTLAHQDADGNWVLNEIPNYGQEFLKCIQSKADSSDTYANKVITTGYYTNPNLLDNWYFGNPINQRGGKIVLAGITYYSDTSLSTAAGTTSSPYTVTDGTSTYGSISVSGTTYYVAAGDIVDGYILKPGTISYTFDRWKLSFHGSYIYAKNGRLNFYATAGNNELLQTIDSKLSGETIVLSAIVNDVLYCTGPVTVPTSITGGNQYIAAKVIPNVGELRIYQLASGNIACTIDTITVTNFTVKAMKLELGDQQTLAHQDENGNWVLNEIPDYGEQLARCQRYYFKTASAQWSAYTMRKSDNDYLMDSCLFPVEMRITPSIQLLSYRVPTTGAIITAEGEVAQITPNGFCIVHDVGKFTDGFIVQVAFSATADL